MRKNEAVFNKAWKMAGLLILILITLSYAMFQGGFVSWFLFYSFLPFAVYCLLLSLYSLNGFEVSRSLPKSEFIAGERLQIKIIIKRKSSFPLFYLIFEDHMDETVFSSLQKKARVLLFPGLKKEMTCEYVIETLPRGEHVFYSYQLKIGDMLGLFDKKKAFSAVDKIIVYPVYSELIYHPYQNHYDQGMTTARESVQRDTSMAIGVRDYQPGDRFSWINWKATAKRNDMMTKEFEQRHSHDVFIVMDCAPDRHFEAIVSFTASIIRAILKKGAQTGLLTVSQERIVFPIRGGDNQFQSLLYHLAKIQPKSSAPLERILDTENTFIQQSVSMLIVTAQITWPLIEKASFLVQKKGTVLLFLLKGDKESLTQEELSLKSAANNRGVRIVPVHEGYYEAAFSEVKL